MELILFERQNIGAVYEKSPFVCACSRTGLPDCRCLGAEEVMGIERVLLQTIKFDLHVDHPYTYLLQYQKVFKLDREKKQTVLQNAWTFVNDSMSTTLCLIWEPEVNLDLFLLKVVLRCAF
uniref:FERM domain-containing protein n=1 Tax=Ascaris lumbricoides TaxID=6252 RepID=A0A0M3HH77_ASCLU